MSSNPSNTNAQTVNKNANNNWNVAPQQGTQQPWGGANTRPHQPQPNAGQAPTAQGGQQQQPVYPPTSGMYAAPGYSNQYGGGYAAQQAPPAPANTGGTSLSKAAHAGASNGGSANQVGPPPPYAQQGYMMYQGQVRPGAPPPQYYQQYNPQFNRNYPVGNWQPNYPTPVYHPNQSAGGPGVSKVPANPPRRRGPSLITTKDGKKLEFASSTKTNSSKAGSSMLAQAQALMASNKSAKQLREEEKKKKEEEERLERERIEKEEREKREKEEKERLEKERLEREEKARREAEEKARKEKELRERREREEKERLRKEQLEREQRLEKERQEEAQKPRGFRPGGGLRPGGSRRFGSAISPPPMENLSISRKVYTKAELLSYRDKEICQIKPDDLPDFTIRPFSSGNNQGPRNRGGRPDSTWSRGQSQPKSGGNKDRNQDSQWNRGQAPPPMKNRQGRGQNNRRGSYDPNIPFEPLAPPSENRWMPKKDDSAFAIAEKAVMGILNKMTKEKFGKLSQQMCEIDISSNEILSMMIHSIYEKAIDEPKFGDIYAQLCILLAKKVSDFTFIKIIPTDEQKGVDGFRWSNNVSSSDSEVLGPFTSPQECIEVALDKDAELKPMERGDKQMSIVHCRIIEGTFIKILSHDDKFYAVCFPLDKAEECGQQLSPKIFSSDDECMANARKKNSFKSILLNKCQDEFNKQDIYVDWKKEKKEFDKIADTLSEGDREEKKEELMFRRMKIKKQMLGNIKFIGELYKMTMIKEHIMHFCIRALLKFNCTDKGDLFEMEDDEMDEEDHEALCNLFTTIGKTFDMDKNRLTVNIYFKKMIRLSNDKSLSSRYRFMYKDLIDLRANRWKSRREQETTKTLTEIRKDVAREERQQAQEYRSTPNKPQGNRRSSNYNQSDNRRASTTKQSKNQPKPSSEPDGWAVVGKSSGRGSYAPAGALPSLSSIRPVASKPEPKSQAPPPPVTEEQKAPPLSREKLENKIKNMRTEFLADQSNTEDVFYAMEEMMGTSDYGRVVVEKNMDFAYECKDPERKGVIALFTLLYTKGKLSSEDFEAGMLDMIEFVDSFEVDIPKACQYLGEVLSACLKMKALSKEWLKEKCALAQPGYPEKVVFETEQALSRMFNIQSLDSL